MHLHLLSADLSSECLKNKRHFNSFATSFLVPPELVVEQLEATGRTSWVPAAEEARLKLEMRCPLSGAPLANMPAVKARLASTAYREGVQSLVSSGGRDAHLVPRWPAY